MNARVFKSTHQTRCPRALSQLAEEAGAIGVEYGLIAALIALAILGTLKTLGVNLVSLPMQSILEAIQAVIA